MSPRAHQARAARLRHSNRAGGFGAFNPENGDDFTLPFPFPPSDATKTKTQGIQTTPSVPEVPATPSTPSVPSVPAVPSAPSVPPAPSTPSSSSVVQTSSSAPLPSSTFASSSSSVLTTSSTSTTHRSASTTYSGTALGPKTITRTTSAAVLISSAAPSTSSALVAPVVGGVVGGIAGLAILLFLITFFMRRRQKDDEVVNFDPGVFRRSAMLISDPPTHQDTVDRGYNPPAPPTMVQRGPMYPVQDYNNSPIDAHTPTSGSALIFQAPFSPIAHGPASPVSAYDHVPAPAPVLTRNTSTTTSSTHESVQNMPYPIPNTLAVPDEYLDLERTSVTPFQAAQYAEISQRLNTQVPKGLDTPAVEQFMENKMPTKDADLPPLPPKESDPFADEADEEHDTEVTLPMVQELSFPVPPSPAHSVSRFRVDSTPPTLPEIVVQSRVSVNSTYLSEAGSPFAPGFPASQTVLMKGSESPMGSRFPVTPSPLASSFVVPSPPATREEFVVPAPPPAAQPRPDAHARQSVYTLYDPEDAYGGI
ncbi:hypothetical protein FB45DRAFT_926350 [Roridomyces roridus]|uniref:Transmembrane protein n=1 Tax=Roridomyces roridus TaxID=1738132 RepID=A0AAD7BKZ1_9AGAR|nr:hypothetical protein FB45DRAFT_926350 [Roridomyces roridus]